MTQKVQRPGNEVDDVPAVADCKPEQMIDTRYLKALDGLVADAVEGNRISILADTLAWTIARISVNCGVRATGDILRRVGGYIGTLEVRREAERQAKQASREGRLPH